MATNASVFNKSMQLIVEYLKDKGFEDIAEELAESYPKKQVENPTETYYPNSGDITELESSYRILRSTITILFCRNFRNKYSLFEYSSKT